MEASQRQLEMDGSSVRALEDRLVIEALTIADERSARVVRERAEAGQAPARTVTDAIEIGTRVLEREGAAAEVDYVRAEFERMQGEARERVAERDKALAQWLQTELKNVPNEVKERVERMLAETRQNQIADVLKELGGRTDKMVRELRESDARSRGGCASRSPHSRRSWRAGEARESADKRVAEAEEAGTRKGFSFEDRAHEAIERIASARGDAASHTGGEQAEGGGKKGDTLVELGAAGGQAAGRVLFEAKTGKPTKNEAWKQLNGGMAARAASFGVLVVAGEENVPAGRETLTEYEGNKMIVAVDREEPEGLALEVAYKLAAARVLMARDGELEVDGAAVRDAAQEAITTLKNAQAIKASLTGIKTSSDTAYAKLEEMVAAVRATLERIDSLVESADPSS